MFSGYSLGLLAGGSSEFVLMLVHPHTRSVEHHALRLESEALFEAVLARQRYFSIGSHNPMPRQPARRASERPDHLASATGKARRARDVAVGGNFAFGNLADCAANNV
jgi:hypothetical protein